MTKSDLLDIRICTERSVPTDRFIDAVRAAIKENPRNAPSRVTAGPNPGLAIALLTRKLWREGRTLKIAFMDGKKSVQDRVVDHAKEWEKHANLHLDFGYEPKAADIRVSFQQKGSWSYPGTDALVIDKTKPTMNYGWLTPQTDDQEYSRVVKHEFGHAFGAIHEHQHPMAGIPWNKPVVYKYYCLAYGWDRQKVDVNIFQRYSLTQTNASKYDKHSIMHYSIPNELTFGNFSTGRNTDFSNTDKEFISTVYPGAINQNTLTVGVAATSLIGKHEEINEYKFCLCHDEDRPYVIKTSGPTNVFMSLYGPDDVTNLIAADDDCGRHSNAKIGAWLGKGEYTVRIRHYRPTRAGNYSVDLQPE